MAQFFRMVLLLLCGAIAWTQEALAPPRLRQPENVQPVRYAASLRLMPGRDRFTGHIDIELKVVHATPVIWLNARSLQFQKGSMRVRDKQQPVRLQVAGENFVAVVVEQALQPGPAQLEIDYTGEISRTLTDGAFQQQRGDDWYIFTKFEPVTARRVFPCFDEPSYKVPWQLTLTFPKGLKAFSNTPVASNTDGSDATTTIVFEQTRPLPSYLLAFAIGPFDEVPTAPIGRNQVPGRVIVPRGRAPEAAYAAAVTPQLIGLLETYFGRPYPYQKLDQIVVPVTTSWGAMENAGLIAYGDFLLSPAQQDTELRQRGRAETMEHEMAHQWFGDLVTMAWWDDLWLNEAFASWVETKLLNAWKPEWSIKADAARSTYVFQADSLTTARKIRQPIEAPGDIANAFDGITYGKGEKVIDMFENYVGPDAFQRAVQLYLSKHEWGNATSADLLAAIDQVSPQSHAGAAFSTFLNQVGFPLLRLEQECGPDNGPSLHVSQARFVPVGSPTTAQESWQVPVCAVWGDEAGIHRNCQLLTKTSDVFKLPGGKTCPAWLSADANSAGYYAVEYENHMAESLIDRGLNELSAAERAALVRNTQLLFSSGLGHPEQNLAFASDFSRSSDSGLVRQSAQLVASVNQFVPSHLRARYAKWIRELFGAKARELGWAPKPGETQEVLLLRMTIVPLAATFGDDTNLRDEATKLAHQWLKDKSGLDPDMVTPVLSAAAWDGDRELFDQLVEAIKQDRVQRERGWMIGALPDFRKPDLARGALDLLLESGIDPREMQYNVFMAPDDTREVVWDFVQSHFDQLNSTLPGARGIPYGANLPLVASGFCDTEHRKEVAAFFEPRMASLPGGARNLANALERIRLCTARAEVTRPAVTEFLEK
jgi:cytosol alanyl aminopeptidase